MHVIGEFIELREPINEEDVHGRIMAVLNPGEVVLEIKVVPSLRTYMRAQMSFSMRTVVSGGFWG